MFWLPLAFLVKDTTTTRKMLFAYLIMHTLFAFLVVASNLRFVAYMRMPTKISVFLSSILAILLHVYYLIVVRSVMNEKKVSEVVKTNEMVPITGTVNNQNANALV